MPKYNLPLSARFNTKYRIVESGCWEWQGALRKDGYGILKVDGRCDGAHRYSYELHVGKIPDGLNILHSCDNRKCVNPDHLSPGTQQQNMIEMHERGRHKKSA